MFLVIPLIDKGVVNINIINCKKKYSHNVVRNKLISFRLSQLKFDDTLVARVSRYTE